MTEIKIISISYKNFKGFKNFEFSLPGSSAVVSGRNGLGKTTLADGFQWLLFGKDSSGAKINPKPRNDQNQEILGLEPTVEAQVRIDGRITILKRELKETWSAKRGELEKTRKSDTTKYFIDDVPTKESDWKQFLEGLGGESSLQMLSNSSFFMSLNWNKRREILIDFTGLTDQQIIDSDSELKEINSFLDGHSIDEMKKILKGRKTEIKQKIDGMPARIQEVTDMKSNLNIGDRTQTAIQKDIDEMNQLISEKESWLVDAKTGAVNTELIDLKQKQADLKVKLADQRAIFITNANAATATLTEDLNKQQKTVNLLRSKVNELESSEYRTDQAIQEKTDYLENHLEKYKELKSIEFDENQTTCPTCGQDLPTEEAEHMRSDFNQRKATEIEQNITLGKAARQDKESLVIEAKSIKKDLTAARMDLKAASDRLDLINSELNYEQKRNGEFEASQVYRDTNAEIAQVEIAIERAANKDTNAEVEKLSSDIQSDKTILAGLNQELQKFEMVKTYDVRLSELKDQDKSLKEQNQEVEKQLWLIEEFTRRKVKRIEESINERFSIVKWKLFDVQKNEGIKEMCEATYNGIEYSSGLNNGARINCDLDIIRTLSRELGITIPVFVDNAESVNTLQPIEGQMIELQVTEDEKLKVEV